MHHDLKATANAFAALIAVIYVICAALVLIARDGLMAFTGNWVHGIDMKALPYTSPTAGGLVVGFVTATVAAWLATYLFAWFYNYFAKQK